MIIYNNVTMNKFMAEKGLIEKVFYLLNWGYILHFNELQHNHR